MLTVGNGSTVGSITLKEAAGKVLTIINANGSYTRKQYNANSTITAASYGTSGNDVIVNTNNYALIDGGAGNDYIVESKTYRTIGNTWNVTGNSMVGGKGDDTMVVSYSTHFKYTEGDGDDVIVGYHNYNTYDSVVEIISSEKPVLQESGNDYILKVGDGSITFKDALHDNIANYILVYWRTAANKPYQELRYTAQSAETIDSALDTVNSAANTVVEGSEGNDLVTNNGAGSTVLAGEGDDTVVNNASNAYIDGGNGNNVLYNNGANSVVEAGDGNDLINNQAVGSTVNAGAGDDYIYSGSLGDTVVKNAVINAGDGNDVLEIYSPESTINAGAGNDTVNNYGAGNVLDAGAGDDLIINTADNVSINAGAGNDTIDNKAIEVSDDINISTGLVDPKNVTINGGTGDDLINLGESRQDDVIVYNVGEGRDTITNFQSNDKVKLDSGVSILSQGAINNGADRRVIVSNDDGEGTIIFKGLGDKTFSISDGNLIIDPGSPGYVMDTVVSNDNAYIQFEDDADWPINYNALVYGQNSTVKGGYGDDTIEGSDEYGTTYEIDPYGGNDVITNFGSKDKLIVSLGDILDTVANGNDLVFTIGYEGDDSVSTITLKDAAPLQNYLQVDNSEGYPVITVDKVVTNRNTSSNVLIEGQTTSGSRDRIVNTGANVTIRPGAGDDTLTGSNVYGEVFQFSYNDGNNVITNFGKNDSLQITSGNATGSAVGNNYVYTISGGNNTATVTLQGAGNREFVKTTVNKLTTYTADVIDEINNTKSKIKVTGTDGREIINNTGENVTIEAKGGNDTITGSDFGEMYLFSSGEGNNVITNFGDNDSIYMTAGKSMTFATVGSDVVVTLKGTAFTSIETLQGAAGKAFVKNGKYLTVKSVDTINNSNDAVQVAGTEFADRIVNSGDNVSIKPGSGNDTIEGSDEYGEVFLVSSADGDKNIITNFGANDSLKMIAGKNLSTQVSGSDVVVTLQGKSFSSKYTLKSAAKMNFAYDKKTSVLTATSNETNYIYNYDDGKKVVGTGSNDFVVNTGANVTIQAGTGNDTVQSSAFGELIQFSSAEGNNVVLGFGENDTLQMTAGKTMTWSTVGADVVVTLKGSAFTGTVTLEDAADLNLKKVKKNGVWNLVVQDADPAIVNTTNDICVNGTAAAEVITNFGDNVTVNGKGGDDTLTGSDAYGEVFAFTATDGNDIITNFGDNDTVKMTSGSIASFAKDDDGNLVIATQNKTSVGSITLQNVSDKEFRKFDDRTLIVETDSELAPNSEDGILFTGTPNDDHMINYGENVTIDGGKDNDTIQGSDEYDEVYTFDALGGNDVVENFGKNDLLKITYGTLTSFVKSGSDYIATVVDEDGSTGTITLKNTGAYSFHIRGGEISVDGKQTIINRSIGTLVEGTDFDDRIINTGDNVTIGGRGGNDTLTGSNVYGEVFRFSSDSGRDVITNFGTNDSLQIVSGTIETEVGGVNGEDIIVTAKGNLYTGAVTLKGAGGYILDTVTNDKGTFLVVDQVDYIINRESNKKVTGTEGDDYIVSSGENVSIEVKVGNDTIEGSNFGEVFLLNSADGNNVITSFGANDTLRMTAGKSMTFKTVGEDVVVTLKGNAFTGYETLTGAAGLNLKTVKKNGLWNLVVNDTNPMLNTKDKVKFSGTKNADYIVNTGEKVTLDSGQGNDTIYGSDEYGELFDIGSGYGENVILNFGENDSLRMVNGRTINGEVVGDDYVLTLKGNVATGHVTLKGAGDLNFKQSGKFVTVDRINYIDNYDDRTAVVGSTGADYITNSGENVTIQAGTGNDTIDGSVFGEVFQFSNVDNNNVITNFGENDTLQATSGTLNGAKVGDNYVVSIQNGSTTATVTLEGAGSYNFVKSADNKYLSVDIPEPIVNTKNGVKVVGTDDADIIINTGDNVTIEGKMGDDTITGSDSYGEWFAFSSGEGNNVITNFGVNDTLKMTAGLTMTTQVSGDDVIVTLKGASYTGTVTLQGVAGNVFQINNSAKTLRMRAPSNSSAEMPAAEDGFWFLEDETTSDTVGEVDAMMAEVDLDNSLGKLDIGTDPSELLTSVGGTKIEQFAAHSSRHTFKK